jgi:ribonucleoside-diphosphate reductase alpha chain
LADEKGEFPLWKKSTYKDKFKIRNCSLLAISPSGSRSILVDSSPGIEPNFGLGYSRKVLGGTEIYHVNKVLGDVLKEHNLFSEEYIRDIIKTSSLRNIELPKKIKRIFVTAYDIDPKWHVRMQSVFQKYLDNAISKTVNFPKHATIEDIKEVFLMAYDSGCKGLTVYRKTSLENEVITIG